jgi:porin
MMNRAYLLGDWDGERTALAEKGVSFDLAYTNDYFGYPHADTIRGHDNDWGRVRFTIDVDFGKLVGIDGLSFHVSAINQNGGNPGTGLQSYANPSGLASSQSTRLDTYWLQQKLFNGVLVIRAGQLAQQDDYGVQEYGSSFVMEPLDYAFGNLFGDITATFDPASKPGVELQLHPYGGFYIKSEFQGGETNPYGPNDHHGLGFDLTGSGVLATEVGWRHDDVSVAPHRPQVEPPSAAKDAKDGKDVAVTPPIKDGPRTLFEGTLPAVYKAGIYNNFADFTEPNTGRVIHDSYLIYAMVNQALFREGHYDAAYFRGLDAFAGVDYSPGNVAYAYLQSTAGFRYTGTFPGRNKDTVGLGVVHTEFSGRFDTPAVLAAPATTTSPAVAAAPAVRRTEETAIELNYACQVTPWLLVQPLFQYYVNPGGTGTHENAVVLGARTKIVF